MHAPHYDYDKYRCVCACESVKEDKGRDAHNPHTCRRDEYLLMCVSLTYPSSSSLYASSCCARTNITTRERSNCGT